MNAEPATATPKPAANSAAVPAIPFRPESRATASDAVGVLLLLVVLLAASTAALWFAKKKGWLDRWLAGVAVKPEAPSLRLEHRLRLSPRTTLYRVSDERGAYLVVESSVNAQLTALDAGSDGAPHA